MMRGENCIDASVSVISRIAKTIDTTVMIEVATPQNDLRHLWIGMRRKEHLRSEVGEPGD